MTSESLSDAANKLGRTQPAVSAAIKALEDQLGMPLFERRGRKLIPVPEAQYLLAETNDILSQMTRVRQTMRSLSVGRTGTLNIAAMPGPVSMLFPKFLASQLDRDDDVSVSLMARTSNQIAELTSAQSLDFAFADAPTAMNSERLFDAERISADSMVALPVNHPLAVHEAIHLDDLKGVPMGMLHASHSHAQAVSEAFRRARIDPIKRIESHIFLPIFQFVAAGQCCAIIDPLSVFMLTGDNPMVKDIAFRPMRDPIRYDYAIYAPRYRPISIAARNLRDAWRTEVIRLLKLIDANPTVAAG